VRDADRIDYLERHLAAVEQARAQGAPVVDYFAWSLMDNFEWAEGYRKTFGLVQIDAKTQDRRPKASFAWYAERVRR
jgi:beta-glucosidase